MNKFRLVFLAVTLLEVAWGISASQSPWFWAVTFFSGIVLGKYWAATAMRKGLEK